MNKSWYLGTLNIYSLPGTLFVISFLISFYSLYLSFSNVHVSGLEFLFIIPSAFTFCLWFFSSNKIYYGPGLTVMHCIMFLRYVFFFPFYILSDYESDIIPITLINEYVYLSYYIILIEMFVIFITIKYFTSKSNVLVIFNKKSNPIFVFLLVSFSLGVITLFPELLINFNFVFDSSRYADPTYSFGDEEVVYGPTFGLELIKFSIIFLNLYLFEKYCWKFHFSKQKIFIFLSILSILIFTLFYIGVSRASILLPFLSYFFIVSKFYKEYGKKILYFISVYFFILMLTLTIYKQFRTSSISEGVGDLIGPAYFSNFINDYTSSFPSIYQGLYGFSQYEENNYGELIKNDYLSSIPLIHRFANMDIRTSTIFNNKIAIFIDRASFRILPMSIQGYMHLGLIFFFIYPFLTVLLIIHFDSFFQHSKDVYTSYAFALVSVGIGFSIGYIFTYHVIGRIFKLFIPMILLAYANNKKFKF